MMTKEEISLQVAISCIQGILEAKHGLLGEILPAVAVTESFRIADEFVKQWENISPAGKVTAEKAEALPEFERFVLDLAGQYDITAGRDMDWHNFCAGLLSYLKYKGKNWLDEDNTIQD